MVGTIVGDKEIRLTPAIEAMNLAQHGTAATGITARNIVQAANQDLKSKRENAKIRAARKPPASRMTRDLEIWAEETTRNYAFLSTDVKDAESAHALISAALKSRDDLMTKIAMREAAPTEVRVKMKPVAANTYRIYQSEELLREALSIAALA